MGAPGRARTKTDAQLSTPSKTRKTCGAFNVLNSLNTYAFGLIWLRMFCMKIPSGSKLSEPEKSKRIVRA